MLAAQRQKERLSLGVFFCLEYTSSVLRSGANGTVGKSMSNPKNTINSGSRATIPGFDLENEEEEEETIESILEDYDLACEEPADTRLYITTPDDDWDDDDRA